MERREGTDHDGSRKVGGGFSGGGDGEVDVEDMFGLLFFLGGWSGWLRIRVGQSRSRPGEFKESLRTDVGCFLVGVKEEGGLAVLVMCSECSRRLDSRVTQILFGSDCWMCGCIGLR